MRYPDFVFDSEFRYITSPFIPAKALGIIRLSFASYALLVLVISLATDGHGFVIIECFPPRLPSSLRQQVVCLFYAPHLPWSVRLLLRIWTADYGIRLGRQPPLPPPHLAAISSDSARVPLEQCHVIFPACHPRLLGASQPTLADFRGCIG